MPAWVFVWFVALRAGRARRGPRLRELGTSVLTVNEQQLRDPEVNPLEAIEVIDPDDARSLGEWSC